MVSRQGYLQMGLRVDISFAEVGYGYDAVIC